MGLHTHHLIIQPILVLSFITVGSSFTSLHRDVGLSGNAIDRSLHQTYRSGFFQAPSTRPSISPNRPKIYGTDCRYRQSNVLYSLSDDFIDAIIGDSNTYDEMQKYTHMIGIPLESNHDLVLELESIQRGILYHCPLLINSCITSAVLRMPLLYVDSTSSEESSYATAGMPSPNDFFYRSRMGSTSEMTGDDATDDSSLLTSRDPITKSLHQIVQEVVQEMVFVPFLGDDDDNASIERNGLNQDNVQPLLIPFRGLEVDGEENEVLHAIGIEEDEESTNRVGGTQLLRNVVMEIKRRIEDEKGWTVILPSDNPQGKKAIEGEFRPRIPFMRLPPNFKQTLPNPKGPDGKWEDYSDEEKASYIRFPEEGGNGISPIFWYKWWDDILCKGPVRIRELAVYGRTAPLGLTETSFYVPHLRTKLPDGNDMLQSEEARHQDYDSQRRVEQERLAEEEEMKESFRMEQSTQTSQDSSSTLFDTDRDMRQIKSTADRRMIETIYESSPDSITDVGEMQDIIEPEGQKNVDIADEDPGDLYPEETIVGSGDETQANTDAKNESTKANEIIQSIAKPFATKDWSSLKKKNKPKPEDNPIFQRWRESQENNDTTNVFGQASSTSIAKNERELPPYPCDDHFVGLWKLVSLPGGVQTLDEQRQAGDMSIDSSVSENLILRVDGSTAGGPILDSTGHRAAGGLWKWFTAEFIGKTDDDEETPVVQNRLRIRLFIPPSKEQVLVMEGELKRGIVSSVETVSERNIAELRKTSSSSSFVETSGRGNNGEISQDTSYNADLFLSCSGEAWLEDATGKGKRKKLGKFTIVKMKNQDPSDYQYTIPAPRRYQD